MGASITIISVTTILFGLAALFISSRARKRLTPGLLRNYIDNFAVCLAFIVIFSIWQAVRSISGLSVTIAEIGDYPEYIFIVFAYVAFIITSYKILRLSKEFGFVEDGKKIDAIVSKKKKKNEKGSS